MAALLLALPLFLSLQYFGKLREAVELLYYVDNARGRVLRPEWPYLFWNWPGGTQGCSFLISCSWQRWCSVIIPTTAGTPGAFIFAAVCPGGAFWWTAAPGRRYWAWPWAWRQGQRWDCYIMESICWQCPGSAAPGSCEQEGGQKERRERNHHAGNQRAEQDIL